MDEHFFETRAAAAAATIPLTIGVILTGGYATAGDGGGATYKRVASEPGHAGKFQSAGGAWWELSETDVDVRAFGAKGDGVADDVQAFRDALSYALAKGLRNVVAYGTTRFSSTLAVSNISTPGMSFHIERLVADPAWPAPPPTVGFATLPQWRSATPLIDIGTSGGAMVNQHWYIGSADGASRKADLFRINRLGGSHFFVGYAKNCNIVYKEDGTAGNTASNRLDGNYHEDNNVAVLTGATAPFVAEGTMVATNFITSNSYGGVIFGRQSNFASITKGQLDFNGRNLAELTISASGSSWTDGVVMTGGASGTKCELVTTYQDGDSFKALVLRDASVQGTNAGFTVGESISDGTTSRTINAVRTTTQGYSTFYFDVVMAASGSGFNRGFLDAPYLGGFVGNNLNSVKILWGNANNPSIAWLNGVGFASSPTQSLIYSGLDGIATPGRPALEITSDLFAPRRPDIYLGAADARIYNSDSQLSLPQNGWVTIFDGSNIGANSFGRCYDLNLWRIASTSHRAKLQIVVDSAGNLAFTDLGSAGFSFQVSGGTLVQAVQTSVAATMSVRRTLLRVG
ncbi:hypothetical protein [Inquilinus sp.]|uniref:hypothetical protein n=1 Tax=Inquilinus sp. TaxID=1932117 RepID=UPI0031E478CE